MKEITSLGNAVVKDVCNLKQKKYRERSGSFVVEGLRAVEEAVRYAAVQKLFAVPDAANTRLVQLLADAAVKNIELYSVTEQVMKKMSDTERRRVFGGVQQAAGFYSGRRCCACA